MGHESWRKVAERLADRVTYSDGCGHVGDLVPDCPFCQDAAALLLYQRATEAAARGERVAWRHVADELAARLMSAQCLAHDRRDKNCPFCDDVYAHRRYVAAGGDMAIAPYQGRTVPISRIRPNTTGPWFPPDC